MYGAILGDMIGSPYEFDKGYKTKDFPLFSENCTYTDDTVMTLAVAEAFMNAQASNIKHFEHGWYISTDEIPEKIIRSKLIESMQRYGKRYPHAGYGGMFRCWLSEECLRRLPALWMHSCSGEGRGSHPHRRKSLRRSSGT